MGVFKSWVVVSFVASSVQAALSATGFTVSLTDVDYFLPPKPVAKISGCNEIQGLFEHAPFVPFTVVKAEGQSLDIASLTAGYKDDDVWQEGFMQGICLIIVIILESAIDAVVSNPCSGQHVQAYELVHYRSLWHRLFCVASRTLLHQCCRPSLRGMEAVFRHSGCFY